MSNQQGGAREVFRGKLLYRPRKGSSQFKPRNVRAVCGSGGKVSAVIDVVSDYEDRPKSSRSSSFSSKKSGAIELVGSKIDSVSTTTPSESPRNSMMAVGSSPRSGGGLSVSPGTFQLNGGGTSGGSAWQFAFKVTTASADVHEFRCESENTRLCWIKLLGLLIMFPYSRIPEEPAVNPLNNFRKSSRQPAGKYDSVWMVYILPEEVGSVCGIIGVHYLALRSGTPNGVLHVFNAMDLANPIISWDSDKVRRTGKTGNLVFVEIGRRCKGGPGLVWMHTQSLDEAQILRETLHRFLFLGDGKAVGTPRKPSSQLQPAAPIYDTPRPASDTPPHISLTRRESFGSLGYHSVPSSRGRCSESDSGHPSSPMNSSLVLSPNGSHYDVVPPPIRMDKHPSRVGSMHRQRSAPCEIQSSRSTTCHYASPRSSSHSSSTPGRPLSIQSNDSLIEETTSDLEPSPPLVSPTEEKSSFDDDSLTMGHMDAELQQQFQGSWMLPPQRSYTCPETSNAEKMKLPARSLTTSTCQRNEYETMVHPRALVFPQRTTPGGNMTGISSSEEESNYILMHSSHSSSGYVSGESSLPSSASAQYDLVPPPLSPISEVKERERPKCYENHPLPPELKRAPSFDYRVPYENVLASERSRSGSMKLDQYENVTLAGTQVAARPVEMMQRKPSLRRNSDKETVVLSSPGESGREGSPRNGLRYAQVEAVAKHNGIMPSVKPVSYSSVGFQPVEQK